MFQPKPNIRKMTVVDLEDVLVIESACFEKPWSREAFSNELKKEYGQCFVAEIAERIVGYIILWLVADEIHIANIAVHPSWQRQGIGEALLKTGLDTCPSCSWIGLEVREANTPARALYKKFGFMEVGIRKDYYGKNLNAVLMVKGMENVI